MDQNNKITTPQEHQSNSKLYSGSTPLSNDLSSISEEMAMAMFSQTKDFMGEVVSYKELMMMYSCAIKEVRTKFEVLSTEFNIRYQRNPISYISSRLKRTSSIIGKLTRKGLNFSVVNIENELNDIAGIRVVCKYLDDIYTIADSFTNQDDITLIERKDYIANPKPNGYRSLHLIIEVPIFFAEFSKPMRVEVQIRTMAMDFWASLEHQLKYKQEIPDQDTIISELTVCAESIAENDRKMLEIRKRIEGMQTAPSEDDILIEKINRLDLDID